MSITALLPRSNLPLAEVEDGRLKLRFHDGQAKAWKSEYRFLLVLAGTRSGKTSWSPWWLWREIQRKGPGDYLMCAPTYKLLDKAAVPYLVDALSTKLQLGKLIGGASGRFEFSKFGEWRLWDAAQDRPTRIVFGHADEPESLEAAQYKAAVCDEAGQKKFKRESWEAIQRRLAIDKGRALFPTTPYSLNWLKDEIHDRAVRRRKGRGLPVDADYDLVNFESIMNPAFPLEEWDRAKATLPKWKFDLFYRGWFTRPAGAIYDCFDSETMVHPETYLPDPAWRVVCGIDFGAPNFAAVFMAEELVANSKPIYHVFAEYRPEEARTSAEHVAAMRKIVGKTPGLTVGGAKSEGQWRAEFSAAGWPIHPPDQPEVEVGINRTYATIREGRLFVSAACPKLLADIQSYSRPVDEEGNPLEGIEDKDLYHSADALRYPMSWLNRLTPSFTLQAVSKPAR